MTVYGCDVCQDVCPYTRKFSHELKEAAFAARPAIAGKHARTLALELLAISQPEFSAAFKGSPMKRAKLPGLKRNAAVALGNVGSSADVAALAAALSDDEPLARGNAAWALGRAREVRQQAHRAPVRRTTVGRHVARAEEPQRLNVLLRMRARAQRVRGSARAAAAVARPSQPVRVAMPACAARHRCGVSPVHRRKARKKAAGSA
jgi:epoxyqueuosine reductase